MIQRLVILVSTVALVVAVMGVVVMALWNALMPQLFGLSSIDFWQAIGLFVLLNILFGATSANK